jgi:hypothetical protein
MAKDRTLRDVSQASTTSDGGIPPEEDEAVLSVVGEFADRLKQYVDARRRGPLSQRLLGDYLTEGVLVAALKMLGPEGDHRLDEGTFWQIIEEHCPVGCLARPLGEVRELVRDLFGRSADEEFRDGFDSFLSLGLQQYVLRYGEAAVEAASDVILNEPVNSEAAAEALRCLAEMQHDATYEARRALLERGLDCPSHFARDGAVIGLEDLSDPRSIPALEAALAREEYDLLRDEMARLLGQLREKAVSP